MAKIRKRYSAEFKAKVALESIRGQRSINEIASHYGVHPNLITNWKKQAIDGMTEIFSGKHSGNGRSEKLHEHLYQKIGELKVELDWLKKKIEY
jgi:putative transposase